MGFVQQACDGLWDVLDAEEAVQIVCDSLALYEDDPRAASDRLVEYALRLGSTPAARSIFKFRRTPRF